MFKKLIAMCVLVVALSPAAMATPAPDLSLQDLNGQTHTLKQYRGKWVVLNYWATWCPPCIEELPELSLFHEAHKDTDAVVWGINSEEISKADLNVFLEDFLIDYPLFKQSPYKTTPFGAIRAMPTTILIDPQGEVAVVHEGGVTKQALENFINSYQTNTEKP